MNYTESQKILEKVQSSQKILLSCHHHPDSDTVGCATALAKVLREMNKTVKVICPDHMPNYLQFMKGSEEVDHQRFEEFNFSEWDLYIVCDTSGWGRLFIDKEYKAPSIPVIVIDNHTSNSGFGEINLLDYKTSSVCEMLCNVFEDWGVTIDQSLATNLFAGVAGDTGGFQFEVHTHTFDIADMLLKKGADIETINFNLFENKPLELIKFWGLAIDLLQIDPLGFAYIAIPFEKYKEYEHVYGTRETTASLVISKVANTKFGFIMTEEQPGSNSVSFRSRSDVDTSKIAMNLGGGGHPAASGAWIRETPFEDALNMILNECRKSVS